MSATTASDTRKQQNKEYLSSRPISPGRSTLSTKYPNASSRPSSRSSTPRGRSSSPAPAVTKGRTQTDSKMLTSQTARGKLETTTPKPEPSSPNTETSTPKHTDSQTAR